MTRDYKIELTELRRALTDDIAARFEAIKDRFGRVSLEGHLPFIHGSARPVRLLISHAQGHISAIFDIEDCGAEPMRGEAAIGTFDTDTLAEIDARLAEMQTQTDQEPCS